MMFGSNDKRGAESGKKEAFKLKLQHGPVGDNLGMETLNAAIYKSAHEIAYKGLNYSYAFTISYSYCAISPA